MIYHTDSGEGYNRSLVVSANDLEQIAETNHEVGRRRGIVAGIFYANAGWVLLCALYLALRG